jgi:hypothetical protein
VEKSSESQTREWFLETSGGHNNYPIFLENSYQNWTKFAQKLKGRTGKLCQERLKNHIDNRIQK